jgi:hypothetical protein
MFGYLLLATEPDAATRRWWSHVVALANDGMEGRDTGSAGYRKAEAYVEKQFHKLGLQPAGLDGYRQPVPLNESKLDTGASRIEIVRGSYARKLDWLNEVTIGARGATPNFNGDLYFLGSHNRADAGSLNGKVVVTLGVPRIRTKGAPAPIILAAVPGAPVAILTIDDLSGPEPPHWPAPYIVSMTPRGASPTPLADPPQLRLNPAVAEALFEGSGHTYAELKRLFDTGATLPNFVIPGKLRADIRYRARTLESDNLLAVLPGTDPVLKQEYVVLSAHLDGYGIGAPWHGDAIYNGAFDDAAYVATLIDLAQSLTESHTSLKRSLLFCIVTGEEKGLLGSKYFTAHPTVPKVQMVADLNLDQVRPIFPLKLLTTLALNDSSLGDTVKQVAAPMGIQIQEDPEPERNLLRRSDHFSFMQIGVPAVNFVFGYKKGTEDEAVYRTWYAERYHSPADDLYQPWIPEAAAKFNHFYAALVEAVANAPVRPKWFDSSKFAPHP